MLKPADLVEKGLDAQMAGLLAVGLVVSFTAGLAVTGTSPAVQDSVQDEGDWKGVYTVTIERDTDGDGERELYRQFREENTLTDQGQNWIRSQIYNLSEANDPISSAADTTNVTFIAVGNGSSPSAGTTKLGSEYSCCGLTRVSGTRKESAFPGQFAVETQYVASLSSGADVIVNTTSLNWNSSGHSIVSGGSFSNANLLDGDKLTVTHNITIS